MKLPFVPLLCVLVLALVACQSRTDAGAAPAAGQSATTAAAAPAAAAPAPDAAAPAGLDAAATLPRYHWRLHDATDAQGRHVPTLFVEGAEPVQLDFVDGRVAVSRLCNTLSGSYTLAADTLRFGPLASTLMACADQARNRQAEAASALFNANGFALALAGDAATPTLTLRRSDGQTLAFQGVPTADTRFGGPPQTVFLEVAPHTAACSHPLMPGKRCLQVRQIQFDAQGIRVGTPGPFENFYDTIEGYEHREGVRNVLRVKRYTVANPPADASSNAYVLDLVVESAVER